MAPARHRRQNWLLGAAAFVIAWYRNDVVTMVRGTLADHARPSAELLGQLAILVAIAVLPLILLASLLFVALGWLRRATERILGRALAYALATLIAIRLMVVPPPPSSNVLTPRPVF